MPQTLVIHPDDRSTDFLRAIYDNLSGVTRVTGGHTKPQLMKMVEAADRVFLLGHGWAQGLLSMGQFPDSFTVIDRDFVPLLRQIQGATSLCIWCHASTFTQNHDLDMFATGMFISEQKECTETGVQASDAQIDASNNGFCKILAEGIHLPHAQLREKVRQEYGLLTADNPVAAYNHAQIFGQAALGRCA
jgi:hypothetical protein